MGATGHGGESLHELREAYDALSRRMEETSDQLQRVNEELVSQTTLHRAIFDRAPLVMMRVDEAGRATHVNAATVQVVGKERAELLGLLGGEIVNCVNAYADGGCGKGAMCRICPVRGAVEHAFATGEPTYKKEGSLTLQSGAGLVTRHFLITAAPLELENGKREVLVSLDDISDRKLLERNLESFAHSASHDLRAPLRVMAGMAESLVNHHAEDLSDEGKRVCGTILTNARRMQGLVDAILRLSQVTQANVRVRTLDMQRLVAAALTDIPEAAKRPDVVRVGELPEAVGDRVLIQQVWANLLSNAFKYSSQSLPQAITVSGEKTDREVVFSVADNGAGFHPKEAHRLFEVFHRLHSASEFPGTGVGLTIVQRIIHRHGGRVWATSEPGQGATFYFALPLA